MKLSTTWVRVLAGASVLWGAANVQAQATLHARTGYVTDAAKQLAMHERERLEGTLARFHARSGSEIAVLIVPRLSGGTIERLSRRTLKQWELGGASSKGILLSVAVAERRMRIEVADALGAVLTALECQRILAEIVKPKFKTGDFSAGIELGVERIIAIVAPSVIAAAAEPGAVAAGAGAPSAAAASATVRPPAAPKQNYGRVFILLLLVTIFGGVLIPRASVVLRLRFVLGVGVAIVWFVVLQRYLTLPFGWHLAASAGGGALLYFIVSITQDDEDIDERRKRDERDHWWRRYHDRSRSDSSSSKSDRPRGGGASDGW